MIESVDQLNKTISGYNEHLWTPKGNWAERFRKLRLNQRNAQRVYDLDYEIVVHKAYKKIKLPTGRQMVDTVISHLPITNPVVDVIPVKRTDNFLKKANKQREFYQALLFHSNNQTEPFIATAAKDLPLRGEAFYKVIYDIDALENMPKKESGETEEAYKMRKLTWVIERLPFKIIVPDPVWCFPSAEHRDGRPLEMIEVYPVYVSDVKHIWKNWVTTAPDHQVVMFTEYWRDDARCFLANGTAVTKGEKGFEENPFKVSPYGHAYSGLGSRTPGNEPDKKAVNILFEALDVLKQQSRWSGYLDKAVEWAAMPIFNAGGEKADYGEGGEGLKPEPGMVIYGGEEHKVTVDWAAQNLPRGIFESLMWNDSMIRRTQPEVLRGEAPRGIEAGYPMALMIGQARLEFGCILQNLKMLVSRSLETVRQIIRNVTEDDLALWGESQAVQLNKDDCEGAFKITVDFDTDTPEAKADRALVGQRLRQGGSISHYTELKTWQNNKNPEEEMTRQYIESLMEHPAMKRAIAVKALNRKYGAEMAAMVEEAMIEGEEGAIRKSKSSGIPVGGKTTSPIPEDVLRQAITEKGKAERGETEVKQ